MIILENVVKTYRTGAGDVKALDNINLQIKDGQFVVVRGPSGSGILVTVTFKGKAAGDPAAAGKRLF